MLEEEKENKVIGRLSQEESEQMQRYLKEISRVYGIRLAVIGEFLGKQLKGDAKGEHQWFMAFTIIDEIFDEMMGRIMTALEDKDDDSRRKSIAITIRETQDLIKEELPLPKVDEEDSS